MEDIVEYVSTKIIEAGNWQPSIGDKGTLVKLSTSETEAPAERLSS